MDIDTVCLCHLRCCLQHCGMLLAPSPGTSCVHMLLLARVSRNCIVAARNSRQVSRTCVAHTSATSR
jgi:hypothetical protein